MSDESNENLAVKGSEVAYWEEYYASHREPDQPSPFATFASTRLGTELKTLIELGCGNGRDALHFANHDGRVVIAVDQCANEMSFLNERYASEKLQFAAGDFTKLDIDATFDCVYSRFTFHAIDEESEIRTIAWIGKNLNPGGMLALEVRSTRDELFGRGEKISENEFSTDHYRRFADFETICARIEAAGLVIEEKVESNGLAVWKDEDPVVIRIFARKHE